MDIVGICAGSDVLLPIVDHFVLRAMTEDLMLLYNLPAFMKEDSTAFLTGVARAKQLIKKVRLHFPVYTLCNG